MKNDQYFIEALQSGAYQRMDWIIDVFTIAEYSTVGTGEEAKSYQDFYPYQLVKRDDDPESLYFSDHQEQGFTKLSDYKPNTALFRFSDIITLQPNDIPNVKETVTECYGNVIINMVVLCYPFGDKIPFQTGKLDGGVFKKLVVPRFTGKQKPGEEPITVDELTKHFDAVSSLEGWVLLCAPVTPVETLAPTPGVIELRNQLYEKHKHELDNPAVVASIAQQLADYERKALKGTEAEGFYMGGKSYDVVRMKRFLMYGLEGGMGDSKPVFIPNSLNEGWNLDVLPNMIDGLRGGSYARGKETALGGELYNLTQRAFQNIRVDTESGDCGAKHGLTVMVTEYNHKRLVGLYQIVNGKSTALTESQAKSLVGSTIELRTPMLCKNKAPHFCPVCCGEGLAANPTSLHGVVGDVGSIFMYARMKAMHGKAAKTVRISLETEFS